MAETTTIPLFVIYGEPTTLDIYDPQQHAELVPIKEGVAFKILHDPNPGAPRPTRAVLDWFIYSATR